MRIAFLSDALPPVTDGVTRTLCQVVKTLRESNVDFRFLSAVKPDVGLPWCRHVHVVRSLPVPIYPCYRLGLPVARHLDPILDRFAPDVIHVVSPSLLGLYGVGYAERRGVPAIGSFHTDFVSCLPYYGLGRLEPLAWRGLRGIYNRCALTLAPSQIMAERLTANGLRNVVIWRRGVDPMRFSPRFRSDGLREGIGAAGLPVLLYVGRLCREKNLHLLATAVDMLGRRGAKFRLVIVGDGPLRAELQTRLPDAHFTGFIEGEMLSRWYASADVFVFPSSVETFGNVVLEAMASGLAVVAVDKGGVRDLVKPGFNGALAADGDSVGFADAIHELITHPERMGQRAEGARKTARGYRWPEVNRRLLEHYARLVDPQGESAAPAFDDAPPRTVLEPALEA